MWVAAKLVQAVVVVLAWALLGAAVVSAFVLGVGAVVLAVPFAVVIHRRRLRGAG